MSRGRFVRALEEKRARRRYRRGTWRLVFVFLTFCLGIVYLVLWAVPLFGGMVEVRPTAISIIDLEAVGFPEAEYLEVKDGRVVLSMAEAWISNGDEGLRRLSAPVISQSQWDSWRTNAATQEPLDASRLRLVVSFTGEQVGELWPEVKELVEAGANPAGPPRVMTLIGDTEPGRFLVTKPMGSGRSVKNLDWNRVRHLRYERHFHSLGRNLKNFSLAAVFLLLSMVGARWHHSRRGPIPDGDLDPLVFVAHEHLSGDASWDLD